MRNILKTLCVLAALISTSNSSLAESIWVEGENAKTSRMTRNGWYDSVKKDILSGEAWLSHFDRNKAGRANYEFSVEQSGEFVLWMRVNPVKSKLSFRLDDNDWTVVDAAKRLRGQMNIAKDNKPDLRFIAWVKVGSVKLSKGKHSFDLRFESANSNHGAIDCFVLTSDGFVPSGARKPKSSAPAKRDDWFEFVPDDDPLSSKSLIDISHVVDAPAGKHGFLKADGASLRFEKSKRAVKFWGFGANLRSRKTDEEFAHAAKWYRKHGVNIVRQHTLVSAVGLLSRNSKFDAQRLDRYDRWFAALKKEGVYSCWSMIYPHHGAFVQSGDLDPELFDELDAVDKHRDGRRQAIVSGDYINLDRRLQDLALRYFRELLNHKNPYTGLRYKDDPALAIVEFQNESNVFFHTLNSLWKDKKSAVAKHLRRRFFDFAKKKYRTEAATRTAWGSPMPGDAWSDGELTLMGAFHWGADGPKFEYSGRRQRCADYLRFLANVQRDYYARRQKELREIGFRGVTVTTAWKGVGSSSLPNLWCDTAADMIDRHNYFGGGAGGHRITEGTVSTATHLDRPGRGLLNLGLFQVQDKPFAVSEWSHLPPNRWKAEAAPLLGFYGLGLQGWDASCHFACDTSRMGAGWPRLGKYVTETPHYLGQFPAIAFAIHRGHIKEAEPIAVRRVNAATVFSGKDELGQSIAQGSHDIKELRDDVRTKPELLALGKVTLEFTKNAKSSFASTKELWDRKGKSLSSSTGELRWHYGNRFVEVRSPKTQALIGFAGGRKHSLPSVDVSLETSFVSLIFTPLDDLALAESKSILITALARDRQTGTEYKAGDAELVSVGGPPLLLEPVIASIKLAGPRPQRVRALDMYGVPRKQTLRVEKDGGFAIDGRYRTYYYHVER